MEPAIETQNAQHVDTRLMFSRFEEYVRSRRDDTFTLRLLQKWHAPKRRTSATRLLFGILSVTLWKGQRLSHLIRCVFPSCPGNGPFATGVSFPQRRSLLSSVVCHLFISDWARLTSMVGIPRTYSSNSNGEGHGKSALAPTLSKQWSGAYPKVFSNPIVSIT